MRKNNPTRIFISFNQEKRTILLPSIRDYNLIDFTYLYDCCLNVFTDS